MTPSAVVSRVIETSFEACCCEETCMGEKDRTALIKSIVSIVKAHEAPAEVHEAALTLIGWLARRRDCESPCTCGVLQARQTLLSLARSRR